MEDKTPNEEEPEKVEYNLSAFKIGWIAELIRRADIQYLAGHIDHAFESWKCIYGQISSRLSEEEKKQFKKKEKEYRMIDRNTLDKRKMNSFRAYHYEKYYSGLQKMLKKYGFDIKEKESEEYLV